MADPLQAATVTLKAVWGAVTTAVQNAIPIEKWMQGVTNVLKYFSLAFLLVFLLILFVYFSDGGFTTEQRYSLIRLLLGLLVLALLVVLVLAMKSGDLLYNPTERSVRRGRNFGTKESPKARSEAMSVLPEPDPPTQQAQRGELPAPSRRQLERGEQQ